MGKGGCRDKVSFEEGVVIEDGNSVNEHVNIDVD